MARVLVLGGGGYIGTTLVPMLLEAGNHVRVIDRFLFGEELLDPSPGLEVVKADTRDLSPSHFDSADGVIDLAALSNDPCGEEFSEATFETNAAARVKNALMAKRRGVGRLVLASSCSVYGVVDPSSPAEEASEPDPKTAYAAANLLAEGGILALGGPRFEPVCLRLATAFGISRRMRFDLAVNAMAYSAWKDGQIVVQGDGSQWRPFAHVRDLARAFCFFLGRSLSLAGGCVVNIGSDFNTMQIRALSELVRAELPECSDPRFVGTPDRRNYRVSFAKLAGLGFRCEVSVRDGIREVLGGLAKGHVDRTPATITVDHYRQLAREGMVL
jgi:nucleoside-diphosphate-sugar epimerase